MAKAALDWDNTLVNVTTQEWLPGARTAIRQLQAKGYDVFIHSCRANWPEGLASIQAKLASEGLRVPVVAKPDADFYIDDKAVTFEEWPTVLRSIPPTAKVVRELLELGR